MMDGRRIAAVIAAILGLALGSVPARGGPLQFRSDETERCLRCHGMAGFAERDSSEASVRDLHVDRVLYGSSAHAALSCRSCHLDVTEYPHPFGAGRRKISCGDDCHAVRRGKPYSHAKEAMDFASSAHGRASPKTNPDRPTCVTCHGAGNAHDVARAIKKMSVMDKMALCAGCHDNRAMMVRNRVEPSAVASYRRSFHYKAIHFGARGTAVCQDCHGVHRVLGKDDSTSSVAAAHLPQTCGQKACHPGARMNFAMSGANHLALRMHREPILRFEEKFFATLTAATMAALVGGIVLDVQRRLGWLTLAALAGRRARAAVGRLRAFGTRALMLARKLLMD